ncbi:TetR/AcrR family transcriptional regulator [Lysinibacillus sp. FJAT-14745]|uniref:TetR/AcrR family transcriptional regulator n=1 Tax=Lysinibacillus sp. FJAT-14745 TaxID=1704289 RepID=UPI0006ABDFCC|nr:TetR/AcrR family transcriptional regulator [Lysinibacillus sp. FJAT-14745]
MTKTDRRIIRTKNEIKQAFFSLLSEKNFEAITVRNITERANINRGTFYLHYVDKYNLLEQYENEIFEKFNAILDETTILVIDINQFKQERLPVMTQILHVFYEEADSLKLILGPNGDPFYYEKMRQFFVRYFNAYLGNLTDKSKWKFPIELTLAYNSNAILGVITYWLQHDIQQSPEEVATMLIETILKGTLEASGMRSIIEKESELGR